MLGLLHVVLAALGVEDGAMDGETLALLEGAQAAPFRPSRPRASRARKAKSAFSPAPRRVIVSPASPQS